MVIGEVRQVSGLRNSGGGMWGFVPRINWDLGLGRDGRGGRQDDVERRNTDQIETSPSASFLPVVTIWRTIKAAPSNYRILVHTNSM